MKLFQFLCMIYNFDGQIVVLDDKGDEIASTRFADKDFSNQLKDCSNYAVDHFTPFSGIDTDTNEVRCWIEISVNTPVKSDET